MAPTWPATWPVKLSPVGKRRDLECSTLTYLAELEDLPSLPSESAGRPSGFARSTLTASESFDGGLIVTAGFPCQDLSIAGRQQGLTGSRSSLGLTPDWLVIENVYHTWRRWMPELRSRLYALGYASLPLRVRAADVGMPHIRARGWLVAHADCERLRELSRWWRREGGQVADELARSRDTAPRGLGTDDGLPDWVDRRRALGNAIVPAAAEVIFRGIRYASSGD